MTTMTIAWFARASNPVEIGFDPPKSEKNSRERGLPFALAADLDWNRAVIFEDARFDYGETGMIALAALKGRLHVVCYSQRDSLRWTISSKDADAREVRLYGKAFDG